MQGQNVFEATMEFARRANPMRLVRKRTYPHAGYFAANSDQSSAEPCFRCFALPLDIRGAIPSGIEERYFQLMLPSEKDCFSACARVLL